MLELLTSAFLSLSTAFLREFYLISRCLLRCSRLKTYCTYTPPLARVTCAQHQFNYNVPLKSVHKRLNGSLYSLNQKAVTYCTLNAKKKKKIPVYNIQKSASNTYFTVANIQYVTHKHKKHIHQCLYVRITITQAVSPYSTVH